MVYIEVGRALEYCPEGETQKLWRPHRFPGEKLLFSLQTDF
jgi:hypothetical protein